MIDPSYAVMIGAAIGAVPLTITARAAIRRAAAAERTARRVEQQIRTTNGITAGVMIEQTHDRVRDIHHRQERMEKKVDDHLTDPVLHRTEWWDPELSEQEI